MKVHEIPSLYRSYAPAMSHYYADGKGRDIYINHNNGGFWTQGVRTFAGKSMNNEVSSKYQFRAKSKNVPPFKYMSDGSGRDSYVIHESGGLKRNLKSLNELSLKDFLRTNEKINFKPKTNDKHVRNVSYCSKAEFECNKQLKVLEKRLVGRLYDNEKHKFLKPKTAVGITRVSMNQNLENKRYMLTTNYGEIHSKTLNNLPYLKTDKDLTNSPKVKTKSRLKLHLSCHDLNNSSIPLKTDINFFKSSINRINDYEGFKILHNTEINKKLNIYGSKDK
jgi:hypothetical protein